MKRTLIILLTFLTVLLFWQTVETRINDRMIAQGRTSIEAFVPTPLTVMDALVTQGPIIAMELEYTLFRATIGLIIGLLLAFLFFSLFILLPPLRPTLLPLTFAINSFPIIGFVPLIIMTFGQGSTLSIIFVSALISYFPILIGLDSTFKNIDENLIEIMNVLNTSKWQMMIKIFLPFSLPNLMTSLRLAIPASIIGATIGEWLGVRTGIGQLITVSLYQLKPGLLYASLLSVTAVSVCIVWLISVIERRIMPWKYHRNQSS